ncbi:MAG: hypothetical protein ACPGVU_07010 [Limisphaerales bacterium]
MKFRSLLLLALVSSAFVVRANELVVYAKIIGPHKPKNERLTKPESWIEAELKRHGATSSSAVTRWVRLSKNADQRTSMWEAALDGRSHGCPLSAWVSMPKKNGRFTVNLSGWTPGGLSISHNRLTAEVGSRQIIEVDTGRARGAKSYVALVVAPAP